MAASRPVGLDRVQPAHTLTSSGAQQRRHVEANLSLRIRGRINTQEDLLLPGLIPLWEKKEKEKTLPKRKREISSSSVRKDRISTAAPSTRLVHGSG